MFDYYFLSLSFFFVFLGRLEIDAWRRNAWMDVSQGGIVAPGSDTFWTGGTSTL